MKDYILQRKAPGANPDNSLQFSKIDGLCCGDVTETVLCRYEVTIDVTSVTTVDDIRIGGTTYRLDANYAMGYKSGRDGLVQNIKDLVESLGYSSAGITSSISGNNFTISIDYSQLDFNWLESSVREFRPTSCIVYGKNDAACCAARASVAISGTDVIVTPVACKPITNVTINDGGGNVYSGALVNGTFSDATVLNGVVTLDGSSATGQNWSGETTLTITISMAGCADVVQVITLTLVAS